MKLLETLKKSRPLHFTLIDPAKTSVKQLPHIYKHALEAGTDAFLVGGSTHVNPRNLDDIVIRLKETGKPVILFPGNINGITPHADAILFLSLINSIDPYYITGVQVQAAPIIVEYDIEVIPTSYIIVGYGGAAGHMGRAIPVPNEKPELIASYALAGAYMGASSVYLEAGSGSPYTVNPDGVKLAKTMLSKAGVDTLLIVGGGIKQPRDAEKLVESGADAVVTGTIVERDPEKLSEIISVVKKYR